ncbi:Hypothetical predicted protein [Olea europaea subsp. europaea]|uniref:Uncharacterized protein n=1 Tax=Olea europaea subsp. europaea TaxID=158383 RepID=A0A8S0Q696_OLEEU|nr:Hypothetical predicted protein [Olea europaea subsp. europaea]
MKLAFLRWVFILPLPDIPRISDKTGLREWGVLLEKQSAWDEYHRFFSSRELPFGVDVRLILCRNGISYRSMPFFVVYLTNREV